jgi:hypothetical protein
MKDDIPSTSRCDEPVEPSGHRYRELKSLTHRRLHLAPRFSPAVLDADGLVSTDQSLEISSASTDVTSGSKIFSLLRVRK